MAFSVKLVGPGVSVATGISGTRYTADAQGVITVTNPGDIQYFLGAGFTYAGVSGGFNNFSATTDPGPSNDQTQDYAPGSVWFNTAGGRVWQCSSAATGAAVWAFLGSSVPVPGLTLPYKNTAVTTVGNGTLTAAAIVGGVITRSGSVAAYTDTTDTAANIIAAIPSANIGQSWEITIRNTVAFAETLAAGTGVTLSGNTVIPPNSLGRFLVTYTAAGAVTLLGLGCFPLSTSAIEANTAIPTVGAGILTAAALVGGLITRSGSTANFNDTTDTAANIIAALPNANIGQSLEITIVNTTSFQQTILAGAGVTLSGLTVIAGNCVGRFLLTYTGAGAVSLYGLWVDDRGINNFSATIDPTSANDNTQGYGVGSEWFNTVNGREWTCLSAATGAAVWSFGGAVVGNAEPSGIQTQFGSAAFGSAFSSFAEEGNLYRNVGNPIAQNGADLTDDILDGFVLPASAFDIAKRGLQLTFQGKFGATANNKRFRVWLNPTMTGQTVSNGVISGGSVSGVGTGVLLFDSGTQVSNNVGWSILIQLFKYGLAGSNTQYSQAQPIFGTTHGGVSLPAFSTQAENAPINIVVTGASLTTGAAGDVVLNFSEANAMN